MSERTKEFFSDVKSRLEESKKDVADAHEMLDFLRNTGKDVTVMEGNLKRAQRDLERMLRELEKRA